MSIDAAPLPNEGLDIATIRTRSVQGVIALISRAFFLQLISFGTSLLIFTVLTNNEVGIYTAVIAIQRFISFFSDFGFGAALIQKKDALTQADITTTFTLQTGITLLLVLLVFLSKDQIGSFFHFTREAEWLLLTLVFCIFLSSFKTIPSILLERKIQFSKLIIPQMAEAITFNLLLITLVLTKHGLASYTWAFLVSSLIGIPLYYYVSPWRMQLGVDKSALHHLKFGSQFQAKNILATIKDDLVTIFLTKLLTFAEIGYIGFGQRLAFFAYRYLVDSVTKVTFSTYSRIQESKEHMRQAIEKSLFFVSVAMAPLLIGLMVTAPYIIRFFPRWEHKWEPAVISLVFFSVNALISSLSGILVNVLDATGKVKKTLQLMVLWTFLTWTLTPLFVSLFGYNGVALASCIITLTIFYTIHLVRQVVDFSFFGSIAKPFLAAVAMGTSIFFLASTLAKGVLSLVFVILVGGVIYSSLLYVLVGKEVYTDVLRIIKKR